MCCNVKLFVKLSTELVISLPIIIFQLNSGSPSLGFYVSVATVLLGLQVS